MRASQSDVALMGGYLGAQAAVMIGGIGVMVALISKKMATFDQALMGYVIAVAVFAAVTAEMHNMTPVGWDDMKRLKKTFFGAALGVAGILSLGTYFGTDRLINNHLAQQSQHSAAATTQPAPALRRP